jgi:hypothetical protein
VENENEFVFDKFMEDIIKREEAAGQQRPDAKEEPLTPQREYIRKYRELPQNRTRWS